MSHVWCGYMYLNVEQGTDIGRIYLEQLHGADKNST